LRIPPTEKRGRTQTSIVTVAIVDPNNKLKFDFNRNEVDRQYTRSSGSGGQNVNRRSTCVQLTHIPTGIQVKCQDTRDQYKNEEIAWQRLEERLKLIEEEKWNQKVYQNRLEQVGSGSRSDKKRSYRIKEDLVIDHETGKQCSFKDFSRGKLELLS
jgi:peptide chain release factor 1